MAALSLNTLNYQHLLYFWVVAREGSIARATGVLHARSPPSAPTQGARAITRGLIV